MEPLLLKVTALPATRRADGSVTLKFVTLSEISSEELGIVDSYRQINGWLAFGPNKLGPEALPKVDAAGRYSKSQELRLKLFKEHLKLGGNKDNFQPYYERRMTEIINQVDQAMEA